MLRTQTQSRRALYILLCIFLSAFLTRLFIAVSYENFFDTSIYMDWARGLQNGFFNAYSPARAAEMNLDYPPLWLYPLYLVGTFLSVPAVADYTPYTMLSIKFFPILFDCMTIVLLYLFANKKLCSPQKALIISGIWSVNPSAIYNSACWGQTDTVLVFLILLTLWFFDEDMPVAGCICYGIAALCKMQALYFAPIIFFLVLGSRHLPTILKSVGAGVATVLAGFLPFMLGSGDLLLPFTVYFGGMGRYPHVNLNAANFYGLSPSLNWLKDDASIIGGLPNTDGVRVGGFSFGTLSVILLVLSLLFVLYLIFFKGKGKKHVPFYSALLMIQFVFMLTTRQHERYQFAVIGIALALYVITELNNRYLLLYGGVTLTTFLNQYILLSQVHSKGAPWLSSYDTLLALISFINIVFFAWSVYLAVRYFWGLDRKKEDPPLLSPSEPAVQASNV